MRSFVVAVFIAVLFTLGLLFGASNDQMVTISYFVARGEFHLPVVLACVFLMGFLTSWLVAFYHLTKHKLANRRLRKQVTQLEVQLKLGTSAVGSERVVISDKQA
ncbi:MAG: LapA family protein [Shewanella sp.]